MCSEQEDQVPPGAPAGSAQLPGETATEENGFLKPACGLSGHALSK